MRGLTMSYEYESQHYPLPPMEDEGLYSQTISLELCEYDKHRKILKCVSEPFGGSFPREVFIKSHHTGKLALFVPVSQSDPLYDEDGWDGEQQIYRPADDIGRVDHFVIYHQW